MINEMDTLELFNNISNRYENLEIIHSENFEYNLDYFNNIPKEDKEQVLSDFILQVLAYKINMLNPKEFNQKKHNTTANKAINSDIKTILKYQEMCERLYNYSYSYDNTLINAPKEIKENYNNNKNILIDLKEKKFTILNRQDYYGSMRASKNEIKIFLNGIRLKYNLKALKEKQLIDSI